MIIAEKILFLQNLKDKLKAVPNFQLLFLFSLILWCVSLPFDNAIYQVSWVLLEVLFIFHVLYNKNYKKVYDILKNLKYFLGFFVLICASLCISNILNFEFLAPKAWHSVVSFVFRYAVVLFVLCYFYKIYEFDYKILIYVCIIASCFMATSGLYELVINYQNIIFNDSSQHGLHGFLRNRNGFGLAMATGFAFIFIYMKNSLTKNILMAIFVFLIIFSFSRSAWVASSFLVIFYALLNFKNIKKEYVLSAIFIVLVICAFFFISDSFQHRFTQLTQGESSHRFGIWQYSFEMFLKQPFFGWGDTFKFVPNAPYLLNTNYSAPHNMIMELLYTTGIFGFCAFMGLNFYIFLHLLKTKNIKILSLFAFFFVICQFDYGIFSTKEILNYIVILSFIALKDRAIL
ncbi:hypothetical protein LMG7974_00567 [Campylobacter majalis]|uniref:O-antigen ligase-related domain-containing protein n=1 Tax=Campylobacter majalis TaxID=2790656 RepID=A0ABN7K5D4_9BACT|nr:O-antigen ligase family protein [Campylobacter majalis]CAD7287687.1 hypothetical protein LMG7974_00567 [Campylobacter majalis]